MSTTDETLKSRQPAYAVALACSLPALQRIAKDHGYAIGLHGSMTRDFDLIAVPWNEEPSAPSALVEAIREKVGGFIRDESEFGHNPNSKPHGRLAWSIYLVKWDLPYIDISVMPTLRPDINEMLVSARAHSKFLYDTACCTISDQTAKLATLAAELQKAKAELATHAQISENCHARAYRLTRALQEIDEIAVKGREDGSLGGAVRWSICLSGISEYIRSKLSELPCVDTKLAALQAERDTLLADKARLEAAIRWACGEEGDFPMRPTDAKGAFTKGPYYWRTELRARATEGRAG